MNEIQIFKNEKFGKIRAADTPNTPKSCLTDLCKALNIKSISNCKSRLRKDGVSTTKAIDSLEKRQLATFVGEGSMYHSIL